MKHFSYPQVPTAKQFQHDSSILFAIRKDDTILMHIDWLLDRYQVRNTPATDSMRRVILADLFMTCNFWIKCYHAHNSRTLKERYPAVLAVFEAAVNTLSQLLRCNRGALPVVLSEIYGQDMHTYGLKADYRDNKARYLNKMAQRIYRLRFKGGMAYQYQWWNTNIFSPHLVPAESKRAYLALQRPGENGPTVSSENFGCFVMTMEREVYMAKPELGILGQRDGMYHSSFKGGDVVTMAGTMLIKGGKILGIRGDSGHYQPGEMNMALLLQGLAMYGVDLHRITLYGWQGNALGNAGDFIKSRMSWREFEARRVEEQGRRGVADAFRRDLGSDPRSPQLPQVGQQPGAAVAEVVNDYN